MFFKVNYTIKPFDLGDLPKVILKVRGEESDVIIELEKIPKAELETYQQL